MTPSPPPLVVGFTGHRPNRLRASREWLEVQCIAALSTVAGCHGGQHIAISPLAEGSDRFFAYAALTAGWELHALLPFAVADYKKTFDDAVQNDDFDRLFDQATHVRELPGTLSASTDAYVNLGEQVVAASDVVIAVWDGAPAAGKGGTPDVIAKAQRAGKRVFCIDANGIADGRWL